MDSANNYVRVQFYKHKPVDFGQAVYVSGNIPALGDWDPFRALKLTWSKEHNWYGAIYIQAPCDFEYKYITANYNDLEISKIDWEEGPNAKMSVACKEKDPKITENFKDVRAMSFNIRYSNIDDGPHYWEYRKELVVNLIKKYCCDFIGVQEALYSQLADLNNLLPMYKSYGRGREQRYDHGEAVPIFYLHDKWDIEEGGTFWLSDTPDVAGSKTYGNSLPRICTWGKFLNKYNGVSIYVYNCHLDHENQNSQKKSARQIKERIEENIGESTNVLLMGDFNVPEDDEVVDIMINDRVKMRDTCNLTGKEPRGTFHHWSGKTDGIRIDYLLIHSELKLKDFALIRDDFKNRYPSDHFPVLAQFTPQY